MSNPGLARLRAHPEAERVRQAVLRDQQAALEKVKRAPAPDLSNRPPATDLDSEAALRAVMRKDRRARPLKKDIAIDVI